MEIESSVRHNDGVNCRDVKQRESPENGDWKEIHVEAYSLPYWGETKGVSWKWRLKGDLPTKQRRVYISWNKGSLLKMEIESWNVLETYNIPLQRNKGSLLKMEIERPL